MSKEEKILKEIERLSDIYKNIDKDKFSVAKSLIQNAAFMMVTLEELQEKVNKDGAVFECVNGNGFEIVQEHPAQKSYNTMINRYNTCMKSLIDLLPSDKENTKNNAGDALAKFIMEGKPKARVIK